MAKVSGPLMSMDASGTIGKTVTFTKNKGRNVVRQWVRPANPQSDAQTGVRASFAGLVALWKADTATLQAAFVDLAAVTNISAFNAFTGFNQKRLSQNKYAANNAAPTDEAPTANVTSLAATATNKYIQLTWTDSVDTDAWEVLIYRKLGSAPTGLKSELVQGVLRDTELWNDGPLAAGTWYYVARAVHIEGGGTTVSASVNAVVS